VTGPRAAVPPRPPRRRFATRAAAALALAGLTLACPGPTAAADTDYPSAGRVAESKARVVSKSQQVGRIEARLAAANARAAQLAVDVAKAVEAYNGARYRLQQAVAAAAQAQSRADAAKAGVAVSQRDLGAFAAAAYRSGGDIGGLSAFLSAQGPRDLITRVSALGSIGESRENALDRLRSAQALAGVLQTRADILVTERRSAERAVEQARRHAEGQLAAQQEALGQIRGQRTGLVRALAKARNTSVRLEQARQQGIEAERRAAARRAAAARAAAAQRRAEEAARQARAAREKADREARDKSDREARDKSDREARDKSDREARERAAQSSASNSNSSDNSGGGGGGGGTDSNDNGGGGGTDNNSGGGGGGGNDTSGSTTTSPPGGSSEGSGAGAESALSFAKAQIGKPYVWAADGPGSFDCSGLTMRAWQQGGVSLPHYSVAQYEQSQKVGLGELRPGDLVFFASGSSYTSIYHVGLYAGSGRMIEAPYTGANVQVSSIYRSSLFGAARP
jgi:cell wall-associated NlpC family hydrolase